MFRTSSKIIIDNLIQIIKAMLTVQCVFKKRLLCSEYNRNLLAVVADCSVGIPLVLGAAGLAEYNRQRVLILLSIHELNLDGDVTC